MLADRPARPLWIVGDAHAGIDPDSDRALVELFSTAPTAGADLLLMGDLFVAWLGPERFWPPHHRPVLEALRAARHGGCRVTMVVGNRDYLCEALAGDVFDEVIGRPGRRRIGGQPTWLLHGDGIVPEDRAYRRWRSISRSRVARAILRRLPAAVGRALPAWTERGLRHTNADYKTGAVPVRALREVARSAKTGGARRCLMGHFHQPARHDVDGVTIHVVPGWREHRAVLVANGDGELYALPFRPQ